MVEEVITQGTGQAGEDPLTAESRLAGLEKAVSERDGQIGALKQSLADAGTRQAELEKALAGAAAAYRAAVVRANPAVPEELITGDDIAAIDRSLEAGRALVARVKRELEAEAAGARVPAGAPQRRATDLSGLSAREKIQFAVGERR